MGPLCRFDVCSHTSRHRAESVARLFRNGHVVVNLARLVEKNALTLRTLASWVNKVWLMLR